MDLHMAISGWNQYRGQRGRASRSARTLDESLHAGRSTLLEIEHAERID